MPSAATGALHPDLLSLAGQIRETLVNFESLCVGLSSSQFNWSPAPASWSVAQCLTHLNSANAQDLPVLSTAIAAATLRHPGPYRYSWLWRTFVQFMEPPVTTKFKAPKFYLPPPTAEPAATLREYHRVSNALLDLIAQANGLDLARIKTPLPSIPFLKMPLGARLALITAHDRRHLVQARHVCAQSAFPTWSAP